MEYVFCFLVGFVVTLIGSWIAVAATEQDVRNARSELKNLRARLTKPESYIWVDVGDHLPTHNREYLVEYCFENYPDCLFHSVHDFNIRENRFQYEGFHGLKVVRWAELPK